MFSEWEDVGMGVIVGRRSALVDVDDVGRPKGGLAAVLQKNDLSTFWFGRHQDSKAPLAGFADAASTL